MFSFSCLSWQWDLLKSCNPMSVPICAQVCAIWLFSKTPNPLYVEEHLTEKTTGDVAQERQKETKKKKKKAKERGGKKSSVLVLPNQSRLLALKSHDVMSPLRATLTPFLRSISLSESMYKVIIQRPSSDHPAVQSAPGGHPVSFLTSVMSYLPAHRVLAS